MSLSVYQIQNIEKVLRNSLRNKFKNYNPEPASMPFHTRLLGKDRMALFSFIHSLNTNFGTSIFEPVALALASSNFVSATSQQTAGTKTSSEAHKVIQNIMDNLATANVSPNKPDEIDAIRKVCKQGEIKTVKLTKVDIKFVAHNGTVYLFDIKNSKTKRRWFQRI